MVRKVALGTLLVGLMGVLVAGAIIRTVDKTENVAEARGLSQGRGADSGPAVADPVRSTPIGDDSYTGDLGESEMEALLMALDDEYKAWSIYDQVIADFGAVRPFTSIQRAEEKHIAALVTLFDRYGLDVPVNEWPGDVPAFSTLSEACEAGVQAEIDNAAIYDQLFGKVDNPYVSQVFTSLQQASLTKHLPAFERCAP